MIEPDGPLPDHATIELLDAYLDGLQRGEPPEKAKLLESRPDLSDALCCLEALDAFAAAARPADAAPPPAPDVANAATIALCDTSSDPSVGFALPRDFGDYELLAELGRGGMGVVFKARQKSLRRLVALKMVLASSLASPEQLRRFAAEAQAAASLRHCNIVRVLDSGQVEGLPYLAMDYIEGCTLAELIRGRRLPRETAVRHVCAVARAVDYLHRQGIIHRDLKPSNILMDADGQPVVTDFGLAKLVHEATQLTRTGVAAGTPSYMAPEQAAGHTSSVTPACDVYSLGAILYELLTGRPPFQAESAIDLLIQVLEREPANPRQLDRSISRTLATICLRCLEKNPAMRYPSAGALADDLERYLKGDVVEVQAARPWQRLQRWARREPALVSRLGVMGLFYLVESFNYYGLHRWGGDFHYSVTAILAVWAGLSFVFQRLMRDPRWQTVIPFAWAVVDSAGLLAVMLKADGRASPLMISYPLLVVASGLWFRVRLVWAMTALAVASYLVLSVDYYLWRPELWPKFQLDSDDHIYFLVGLIAMGAAVAHQVERVRTLSRYYERQG
ncbi:MAG TPA: serine/threonine-protein kinase [Pirellulales bacterium]|nr:serine/threonine-protein kinase [Pirellulales bacterium]